MRYWREKQLMRIAEKMIVKPLTMQFASFPNHQTSRQRLVHTGAEKHQL
jgi:hypothetical protein